MLPLAEIARNTWVPLETLITSGKQMITPQAFTKTLMKRARRAYDFEHDHEYIAKNLANDIIEPLIKYLKYDESEVSTENKSTKSRGPADSSSRKFPSVSSKHSPREIRRKARRQGRLLRSGTNPPSRFSPSL